VRTGSSCTWNASSDASWITIQSGRSGVGEGEVHYRVAANRESDRRSGTLSIGDRTFRVEQDGARRDERPEEVDIEGRVGSLAGSCPSLSFKVRGQDVVTDGNTNFSGGNCRDVRNGREVEVEGLRTGSGPIRARRVSIEDDDDDDDEG
jgi:hypothetical protein